MRNWALSYTLMILAGCTTTQEARICSSPVTIIDWPIEMPAKPYLEEYISLARKGCALRGKCLLHLQYIRDYHFHATCEVLK